MPAWWHRRSQMPTVEERLAYLEGRGEEARTDIHEVRTDVRDLRVEMRDLRAEMIRRFEGVDRRFEGVDHRFDAVDAKFTWVIGIQVTMLVMMAGALFSYYLR